MTAIENILEAVRGKKVYLRTYGCTYNAGDSVKLSEILRSQGCTFTDSSEKADAIIVNTCTVIGPTERKVLKYLKQNRDRQTLCDRMYADRPNGRDRRGVYPADNYPG